MCNSFSLLMNTVKNLISLNLNQLTVLHFPFAAKNDLVYINDRDVHDFPSLTTSSPSLP